jgi:hypothetical protein
MALMSGPSEIDFRYEKGRPTLDWWDIFGPAVQNQKDEVTVWIGERIQRISDFPVQLKAARVGVQQSVSRQVSERDGKKGGTRCRGKPDAEITDG